MAETIKLNDKLLMLEGDGLGGDLYGLILTEDEMARLRAIIGDGVVGLTLPKVWDAIRKTPKDKYKVVPHPQTRVLTLKPTGS